MAGMIEVKRYLRADGWPTRYWGVYLNGDLLAVVLYRKGAEAVAALIVQLKSEGRPHHPKDRRRREWQRPSRPG